jgi:hypothetical protein
MTRQGLRMAAFHAELTFLVRSFFFVLLGIVAQFVGRNYIIPILAILAAIVLARYLGVLGSAWVIHDANPRQKGAAVLDVAAGPCHRSAGSGDCQRARSGVRISAGRCLHRCSRHQRICRLGRRTLWDNSHHDARSSSSTRGRRRKHAKTAGAGGDTG